MKVEREEKQQILGLPMHRSYKISGICEDCGKHFEAFYLEKKKVCANCFAKRAFSCPETIFANSIAEAVCFIVWLSLACYSLVQGYIILFG